MSFTSAHNAKLLSLAYAFPYRSPTIESALRTVEHGRHCASKTNTTNRDDELADSFALHRALLALEQRLAQSGVELSNFAKVLRLLDAVTMDESRRRSVAAQVASALAYVLHGNVAAARHEARLASGVVAVEIQFARTPAEEAGSDSHGTPQPATAKEGWPRRFTKLGRLSMALACSPAMIALVPIWAICWGVYWGTKIFGSSRASEADFPKQAENAAQSKELEARAMKIWEREMTEFDRF